MSLSLSLFLPSVLLFHCYFYSVCLCLVGGSNAKDFWFTRSLYRLHIQLFPREFRCRSDPWKKATCNFRQNENKPNTGLPKITTRWIWRPTTKFTSIDQAYLLNDTILFILLNHLGHRFGQQWTTLLDIASMLAPCPGLTMCSGRRQDFVAGQGSLCFAVKYE